MLNDDDALGLIRQAQREERYDDARVVLVEYLETADSLGDRQGVASGLLAAADNVLHCCPEGYDPFVCRKEAATQSLAMFRELDDPRGISRAMMILASVEIRDGAKWAQEALAIAKEANDTEVVVDAMRHLGIDLRLKGQSEQGNSLLLEAVNIARGAGGDKSLLDALFAFSLGLKEPEKREVCEEYVAIARRSETKRRLVHFLCLAAGSLDGRLDLREKWLEEAMAILRESDDSALESGVLAQLSFVARARGDEAKADELQAMSKAMAGPMPDLSESTKAIEQGDLQKAFELFRATIAKPPVN